MRDQVPPLNTLETTPELDEALQVVNLSRPASSDASLDALVGRLSEREKRRLHRALADPGQFDALVGAAVGETKAVTARRLGIPSQGIAFALDFACSRLDASSRAHRLAHGPYP